MSARAATAESMGRDVLGPVVAEFCLRLWSLGSLMNDRSDTAFVFCARGGLRLLLAYERFLAASGLPSPTHTSPLMVSRVVAMGPALLRTVTEGRDTLLPSAAATLTKEFPGASLGDVATAVAGVPPTGSSCDWDQTMTPDGFAALLRHPDGAPVSEALELQSGLFLRHLHEALAGRSHAVLVDTGLYGTTRRLLAEALPELTVSSALIALSYPPNGARPSKVVGLSVESDGYRALLPRTALLRYWHFVEWLFEPPLASVRRFHDEGGVVRSDLEVAGWQDRVTPAPGTAFAGVVDYLDHLPHAPAERIVTDAARAWPELHRSVVWPRRAQGEALDVGLRSHDFGRDETWSARPWKGPVAALRGSAMWREGEIARAGSPLRWPLLASIQTAYGVRSLSRGMRRVAAR